MKEKQLTIGLLAAAAFVSVAVVVVAFSDRTAQTHQSAEGPVLRLKKASANQQTTQTVRIGGLPSQRLPPSNADGIKRRKESVATDLQRDDQLLDEVTKGLLLALDEACRCGDIRAVVALADKLRALNYGAMIAGKSGSVGRSSVKRYILDALEDAGARGIGPVLDLLADADANIAESAEQLLFKTLGNSKMSDYDRAEIVTSAAEEMTDYNSLTRLFNEFVKMRHSVGVAALKQISASGTDAAKQQLTRVISAFTGDTTITTADQLDAWLEDCPDNHYDDWFYGHGKLNIIKVNTIAE